MLEDIKNMPVWLLWKKETRQGKPTKVPYQSKEKYASSTDPSTWSTYTSLKKEYFKNKPLSGDRGIGIVFDDTANVIGIDFDHCVENGITNKEVSAFIEKANTYTEYSPSGTGVHLLFQKTEQIALLANKHHFDTYAMEVYTSGRYFTFTEQEHELSKTLRTITSDELTELLTTLGYPWAKRTETPTPDTQVVYTIEDQDVLDRMFTSRIGNEVKKTWDGDITAHNNDYSKADHSLCMHLAFWTGKNAGQMERLWLASPLGAREKTQKRRDYRERTIFNAIQSTSQVYTPRTRVPQTERGTSVESDAEVDYDFILGGGTKDKDPVPLLIYPNIIRVIRKDPFFKDRLRKNDFSHFVEYKNDRGMWEVLNDDFISEAREYITENFVFFVRLSRDMTTDAILRAASDNRVNPPRDYFTSLVWDNVPRLNSWLHHTYGVPDDELHQAIGSNWLKGLVKRVMRPGCQFDEVLALESTQGYMKSSSLRVLGKPWHVETTHSIDNKDFYLLLAQNVIVEFSEGEIMDRASVNKLKAEITKTEDQLRPPYERGMVKFARSCVFAVTTNRLELKDDTGNRRWLPVQLQKKADVEWLAENKDQLYAEAYYRVIVNNETTHEYPESLRDLQESRQEVNEGDEVLLDFLAKFEIPSLEAGDLTLRQACIAVLGDGKRIDKLDELRVSGMLRRLHFDNPSRRVDGKVVRRWIPSEKAIKNLIEIKKHQNDF